MNDKELSDYIQRSVADIARKCGCSQRKVWLGMYMLSEDYYKKHKTV